MLPNYNCYVIVHLCRLKNIFSSGIKNKISPNLIPKMIISDLPEKVFSTNKCGNFKNTLKSHLNLNLTDSEEFNREFEIVKSWKRTLNEGSQYYFDLYDHLGNGICLDDFYKNISKNNDIIEKLPLSHFLIIEYFGDSITRNKNQDIFNVYSLVRLNYRLDVFVDFIAHQDDLDYPVKLKDTKTGNSFVNDELMKY